MLANLYPALRRLLFCFDAEKSHHLTLNALQKLAKQHWLRPYLKQKVAADPCQVMGLKFPNRVGLAAGLDKDARYLDAMDLMGFGFIEIGTVTLRPQSGNDLPRLFRLPQANALINRMGFNNLGVDAAIEAIQKADYYGVLGINIGKNKDTPNEQAADEYVACFEKVYPYADYVTINVSSPNTANLRDLQHRDSLHLLLEKLKTAQTALHQKHSKYVPLVLKVAPNLDDEQIAVIAEAVLQHNINGVIATNTSFSRAGVESLTHADEQGGLSGEPIMAESTQVLKKFAELLQKKVALIAVGGVMSAADAQEKIAAGADLVQLYTGFIYKGPCLVKQAVENIAS